MRIIPEIMEKNPQYGERSENENAWDFWDWSSEFKEWNTLTNHLDMKKCSHNSDQRIVQTVSFPRGSCTKEARSNFQLITYYFQICFFFTPTLYTWKYLLDKPRHSHMYLLRNCIKLFNDLINNSIIFFLLQITLFIV